MKSRYSHPENRTNPPELIWPACGAFCNVLWWARGTATGKAASPEASASRPSPRISESEDPTDSR